MSNESKIHQLKEFIKEHGVVDYNLVKRQAMRINPDWRSETWRRGLRNSKFIEAIGKDGGKPSSQNPIMAYKYLEMPRAYEDDMYEFDSRICDRKQLIIS